MKTPRPGLLAICAALAACVTAPKPQPPLAAGPGSVLSAPQLLSTPLLGGLSAICLGSPMLASLAVAPDAAEEARQKINFENYAGAFLNVKGQSDYVSCLEKDKGSEDFRKHHEDALKRLRSSRSELETYQALFPAEKRLVAVNESYSDLDEKTGAVRRTVVLQDGSKLVTDRTFSKLPR